jgi:uncharacterized Zn-binding protein involved in type VI secretion
MKPAARLGDMHTCPITVPPAPPHVGGPILPPCSVTVFTGGQPQARVGDMATCAAPPDVIVLGSPTVLVNGMMAARMGDMTAHGGVIVQGCFTVLIGDMAVTMPVIPDMSMVIPDMGVEGPAADGTSTSIALVNAARNGTPFSEPCMKA